MTLPLIVNKIRADGPSEALGNSYGQVRNNATKWHRGWDLLAEPNSPVFAVADGVNVPLTPPTIEGYGLCVLLEIRNPKFKPDLKQSVGIANHETLYVLYAHLSQVDVTGKQEVKKNGQIGKTGMSGNAGGEPPHLHIEVLLGKTVNRHTPRLDPGELFGYDLYACGGSGLVNQELFGSCSAH